MSKVIEVRVKVHIKDDGSAVFDRVVKTINNVINFGLGESDCVRGNGYFDSSDDKIIDDIISVEVE